MAQTINPPKVDQGDAGASAWPVSAASLPLPTGAATAARQDTGNTSLGTLAGAVSGTEMQVDVVSSALPSGAATSALQTQPGVDIGDVTINNAAGAAAVNIQDGGNAITVDGSVSASVTGSVTANAGTNLNTSALALEAGGNLAGAATSVSSIDTKTPALGQALAAASVPVVLTAAQVTTLTPPAAITNFANETGGNLAAAATSLAILDDAHTADFDTGGGTDTTPAFGIAVPASGGAVVIPGDATAGLKVDLGADNDVTVTGSVTAVGGAAHASPVSGNPNLVAGRASNAVPTDVGADGDAASVWTNRNGAQMVSTAPHIGLNGDPWSLVTETAQYTAAQTSTVLVAGGASEKIVVTKLQIQVFGTTAGTAIIYFGTGAYSRGTSRAIFDGEFAPSATLKPGVVDTGPWIAGANGDDILVTTTNALSITITVWYYVIT